ncbi:hypothetical protein GOC14_07235 [Sinorhizobium meliloti]|nr:hypothetical protein [Sinorhizobium meliloti]
MNDNHPFVSDERIDQVRKITTACKAHLRGHPPEIQGAVLADLISMFVAGHAPVLRNDVMDRLLETICGLVPINEALMFGGQGHPAKDVKWEEGHADGNDHH